MMKILQYKTKILKTNSTRFQNTVMYKIQVKQVSLAKVDVSIGINFVNGQPKLNAAVICVIVQDYEVGHDEKLYVHTVHVRCSWNYFLAKNAN